MEFEFDKEIDAILRQTARGGETAPAPINAHLDPDELAAFAENALPTEAKKFAVAHLADCGRCRTILSNLISLNAETAALSAPAAAAAPPEIVSAAPLPWYRRIFAMPNLAYAMGALILLFGGFLGVIVLQNMSGSLSSEISQSRPQANANAAGSNSSRESDFSAANTAANTVTNTAVTAANSATNSANAAANTVVSPPSADRASENRASASNSASTARAPKPAENAPASPEQPAILSAPQPTPANETADSARVAEAKEQTELQAQKMPPVAAAPPSAGATLPAPKAAAPVARSEAEKSARMQKRSNNYEDSRAIGGKTFRRVGGVWFDAAYTTERQIAVKRGSDEYKKLDAGLRSIAENLSGTVVVLWKNRAYRIQ